MFTIAAQFSSALLFSWVYSKVQFFGIVLALASLVIFAVIESGISGIAILMAVLLGAGFVYFIRRIASEYEVGAEDWLFLRTVAPLELIQSPRALLSNSQWFQILDAVVVLIIVIGFLVALFFVRFEDISPTRVVIYCGIVGWGISEIRRFKSSRKKRQKMSKRELNSDPIR